MNDQKIVVRMASEDVQRMRKYAEKLGISLSDLVRMVLKKDMQVRGY